MKTLKNLAKATKSAKSEKAKHIDNITTILKYTNATPIRCERDSRYVCCFCELLFQEPVELKKHNIEKHSSNMETILNHKKLHDYVIKLDITGLKCVLCSLEIDCLEEIMEHLKDHRKVIHTDIKSQIFPFNFEGEDLKCALCKTDFDTFRKLFQHMHSHYRYHTCEICAAGFINKRSYNVHYEIHKKGIFHCKFCRKEFDTLSKKSFHESGIHSVHLTSDPGKKTTVQKKKISSNPKKRERSKHMDNITTLFNHTNATPLRCQKDIGYGCCFCEKFFEKPGDLKVHTRQTHQCDIHKIMRKKSLNDYHVKLDITDLICNECGTKIDNLEDMMRHLEEHNKKIHWDINNHIMPFSFEDDELRCVICKAEFNKFKKLNEHINKHYRNRVCDVCGAGFINERTFRKHSIQVHKTGVFACKFCQKVFDTIGKKRSHESSVHIHSQMLNKCGYCNKKFKSHRNKEKHIASAHGVRIKEIKCKLCGKVCLTANSLRVHTRRDHLKERNYQCHLCDFSSYGKSCLQSHMLKHTGVRDFQCDICLKSYAKKKTLKEHMRIHADDRRFKCEYCGLAFIQKCSLKGHMQSKHRDLGPSV